MPPATDESQIAAVCVKIRVVDFDVLDSTTLPISGYYVAMCGDDEVARNGDAGSKEWKEVGVVSQSSFRHPRRRRTLFRRAQGYLATDEMCVGCRERPP